MKKIIIGTKGEGFDLDVLLPTRLLIQASSGGGKSYLLRRLVEQLFGKVQVIIIDPEGEFATLREKFDFVLVGKGGETPADVRSAELVAHKLLELNVSAICDIYEMKQPDRHKWVRLFIDALINSPKELWHPCVIVVDEAHVFAPEKGQGESEAYGAMIDLATRGRKRGFCSVYATQRLGKLSKNASAELQNVLIGSTFQDIDRKRASETLGVAKSDERKFFDEIKLLEPGNFFALGRAITRDRISLSIAGVDTTHPKSGKYKSTPPPPTDRVKALLPKLGDLPKEAEEKAKSEADLRKEISDLKRQLKVNPTKGPIVNSEEITKLKQVIKEREGTIRSLIKTRDELIDKLVKVRSLTDNIPTKAKIEADRHTPSSQHQLPWQEPITMAQARKETPALIKNNELREGSLPIGEQKTLSALIQYPDGLERNQLTTLTGYKRSSRDAYLARLSQKGFVKSNGSKMFATEDGCAALPNFEPLPTGIDLQDYWLRRLPEGEKAILTILIGAYPTEVNREYFDQVTEYKRSSRDAYIARLTAKELVVSNSRGVVKASENLF